MRRKDREVTDPTKIRDIVKACHCCRLGFCDQGQVYIVPLNFGFTEEGGTGTFYFHGAAQGRKIDLIRTSPRVGFELDTEFHLKEADTACSYSARFQSVIGTGTASIVTEPEEKRRGLNLIMEHYTGRASWEYPEKTLNTVCVFKVVVEKISCKEHE